MPASDKPQTLRFAINLGNAVLAKTLPDGQPGGITVEIAHKIAAQQGKVAEFITYPSAGKVVADAQSQRWDIAFLAIDPARETVLRFTESYITIEGSLLVKADSPWRSVTQMDRSGVVINVGKGAAYDLHLSRVLQHATLNRLASSQQAIDAFLNGEGDMAAGIRQPLSKAAADNPGYRLLPDNFAQIFQAIAVPRDNEVQWRTLSDWLTQWRQEGSLARIIDSHLAQE